MANTRSAQNHMAHAKLLVGLYHACTWLARGFGAQSRITHPASLPALGNSSPAFILLPSSFLFVAEAPPAEAACGIHKPLNLASFHASQCIDSKRLIFSHLPSVK